MFLSVVTFIIKVQRLILREVSVPVGIVFVPTIVGSQRPRRKPLRTDSCGRAQRTQAFNYY